MRWMFLAGPAAATRRPGRAIAERRPVLRPQCAPLDGTARLRHRGSGPRPRLRRPRLQQRRQRAVRLCQPRRARIPRASWFEDIPRHGRSAPTPPGARW
ncbi:MAG: hypothetical protein MZV65_43875 [Chromatiales bacterium]|nr:hypothetical protein [Chromatiales bacterium]